MRRFAGVSSFVRAAAIAAFVVSGLSACGGGSRADDAAEADAEQAGATSTTAAGKGSEDGSGEAAGGGKAGAEGKGGTTTTTAKGAGAKGAAGSKGAEGAKGSRTTTTADPFRNTLPLTAEVANKCVRPGAVQTITIKAPTGSGVGYQVVYADGLQALMEGHYGGNGAGYVDEGGTWVDTFTVSAAAPPGPASANVLGTHMEQGFGEYHAHFAIADVLGTCRPEDMD